MLLPVRCGAVGLVQEPPVAEGPGRRPGGPALVRVWKETPLSPTPVRL